MRLVGIARLDGEQRGRGFALLPLHAPEPVEAQDAVERLRAIAESVLETPAQRPLAHMQLALQERNQRRSRRQTFVYDVKGPAHLRVERRASFRVRADRLLQAPNQTGEVGRRSDPV